MVDAKRAKRGAAEAERSIKRVGRAARVTAGSMNVMSSSMKTAGGAAGLLSVQLRTLFAGVSALLIIRSATRAMARFEETMAIVQAVTRASAIEFENLSSLAKELGATTRFTASQAGEGLLFLARAGFTAEEAIKALPATLNLAQAGVLELGQAADFASNILSQFGLAAEETARIVDTLIIVSNRANTNVLQLAEAMKFAGPIAGALGISVEETAAAIGVLGDSGIQASLAGTGLRMAMLRLINPARGARQAILALGLSLDEVNPEKKNLLSVFQAFARTELSAGQAAQIFGARTAGAAIQVIRGTEKMKELLQATKEFRGEAETVAKFMDDTLTGSFKALASSVEALFLATGDAGLNGAMRAIVDTITGAFRIMVGLEERVKKNVVAANLLVDALTLLAVALSALAIFAVIKGILALTAAFFWLIFVLGPATFAFRGLFSIMAAHPIGLLVIAITIAISVFRRWKRSTEEVTEATDAFLKSTQNLIAAQRQLSGAGNPVERFEALKRVVTSAADQIEQLGKRIEEIPPVLIRAAPTRTQEFFGLQGQVKGGRAGPEELRLLTELRVATETQIKAREDLRGVTATQIAEAEVGLANVLRATQRLRDAGREAPRAFLGGEINAAENLREILQEVADDPILQTLGLGPFEQEMRELGKMITNRREELEELTKKKTTSIDVIVDVERPKTKLEAFISDLEQREVTLDFQLKELTLPAAEFQEFQRSFTESSTILQAFVKATDESKDAVGGMIPRIIELVRAGFALEDQIKAATRAREAEKTVDDQILETQNRLAALRISSNADREVELALLDTKILLDQTDNENVRKKFQLLKSLTAQLFAARDAEEQRTLAERAAVAEGERRIQVMEAAHSRLSQLIQDLALERSLLGLTNRERERSIFLLEAENLAREAGFENAGDIANALLQERDAIDDFNASMERLIEASQIFGDAFGRAFEDFVSGSKSAKEALNDLIKELLLYIIRQAAANAAAAAFRGIFGPGGIGGSFFGFAKGAAFEQGRILPLAKGGVFEHSRVVPFAKGGVIDYPASPTVIPMQAGRIVASPETFPLQGNRVGLMGEAGPEAVMPLKRMASGRLGVESQKGGGGATIVSRPVTVNMTVVTRDADSFRRSKSQIMADVQRASERNLVDAP